MIAFPCLASILGLAASRRVMAGHVAVWLAVAATVWTFGGWP